MRIGDAVLTSHIKDERNHAWRSYKAPKGKRFVLLVLGAVDKDAEGFDVNAALNALGWHFHEEAGPPINGYTGAANG
jgi:hypothetical protein